MGISRAKNQDKRFNRKEAARYLTARGTPVSAQTLANMASNNNKGRGPSFFRMRWKFVFYLKSDLDAWQSKQTKRIE